MTDFFQKLKRLELEVSEDKGDFSLFAIVLREDASNRWDLLVAAPWLDPDLHQSTKYLVKELKNYLLPNEIVLISKVVILNSDDKSLKNFTKAFHVVHGDLELQNSILFGLPIERAKLITSQALHVSAK